MQTDRQAGRQASREADRQTDTHTHTQAHARARAHTHIHTHTHSHAISVLPGICARPALTLGMSQREDRKTQRERATAAKDPRRNTHVSVARGNGEGGSLERLQPSELSSLGIPRHVG